MTGKLPQPHPTDVAREAAVRSDQPELPADVRSAARRVLDRAARRLLEEQLGEKDRRRLRNEPESKDLSKYGIKS